MPKNADPSDPIVGTSRPRSRNKFLISQLVSAMSRQRFHLERVAGRVFSSIYGGIHGEGGIDVPRRGHDHCRQRPIQCAWKQSNFMSE